MDYAQIRLVALDLDDTTLRPDSTLSDTTRDAICALAETGVEIVIASGRAFSALPQTLLSLGVVRWAITSNGAVINRVPDGERLVAHTLSPAAVQAVDRVIPDGAVVEAFICGTPYADRRYVENPVRFGCLPAYIPYIQTTRRPLDDMRGFLRANADRFDCVNIVCAEEAIRAQLAAAVAAATDEVYITNAGRHLLELADRRAGKGAALCALCRRLGVEQAEAAAFGNADNDVDMVQFAGLGVAVANAAKSCLDVADRITKSNEEDGVAVVLRDIILAKEALI